MQPGRRPSCSPWLVAVTNLSNSEKELDAQENESLANAMTKDFEVSMNKGSYYNDDLDMDQQRQEYWDNL